MKNKPRFFIPMLVVVLTILACSMPGGLSNEQLVMTSVAKTQAYERSLTPMTDTPTGINPYIIPSATLTATLSQVIGTPTHTATLPPAVIPSFTPSLTPSPGEATGNCDIATFIKDVSVPDGTVFSPNASFTKTWRLKNVGTCTWTTSYKVVYFSGDQMGGPVEIILTKQVPPDDTIDISIPMVAPGSPGEYRGNWKFKNASGQMFGLTNGNPFYVEIKVANP